MTCQLCGGENLQMVLSLGSSPVTCAMHGIGDPSEAPRFPLELLECQDCSLVQLSCIVDRRAVFPPGYTYSSGNSGQLRKHFAELASKLDVSDTDLVVDIGANDGTFLRNLNCVKVGVEPTNQIQRAVGLIAWQSTFTPDIAEQIIAQVGHARYVTAMNVLAHVEDPHDFLEGVRIVLADGGQFVTENHDLASIVDGGQWDTIYHEHLRYYTPASLTKLLNAHGLYAQRVKSIGTHGGSFRTWASTAAPGYQGLVEPEWNWKRLREDAKRAKWYLRSFISAARGAGDRVAALGATARGTTILSYCELTHEDIEAVYEVAGSDKLRRYMPGTRIPVLDEAALFEPNAPENLLLLSWHLADLIVPKLRENGYTGTIIVPLPKLRTLKPEPVAA